MRPTVLGAAGVRPRRALDALGRHGQARPLDRAARAARDDFAKLNMTRESCCRHRAFREIFALGTHPNFEKKFSETWYKCGVYAGRRRRRRRCPSAARRRRFARAGRPSATRGHHLKVHRGELERHLVAARRALSCADRGAGRTLVGRRREIGALALLRSDVAPVEDACSDGSLRMRLVGPVQWLARAPGCCQDEFKQRGQVHDAIDLGDVEDAVAAKEERLRAWAAAQSGGAVRSPFSSSLSSRRLASAASDPRLELP